MVRATNPLRAEESVLRTAVLPGLLRAVAGNRAQGLGDVALFELGRVFLAPLGPAPADAPLPDEPEHVALALAGTVRPPPGRGRPTGRRVRRGRCRHRGRRCAGDRTTSTLEPANLPGHRAGRAARVVVGGHEAGTVGEVAPEVLAALGLEAPVVAAELVLDTLLDAARRDRTFRAPSRYPASTVDLAFVFDERVSAADVVRTLRAAVGDVLEDVRAFDVFRSDALGDGQRSLAFALRFRAPDRTLTDADVGTFRQRAIDAVTTAHGGELRG